MTNSLFNGLRKQCTRGHVVPWQVTSGCYSDKKIVVILSSFLFCSVREEKIYIDVIQRTYSPPVHSNMQFHLFSFFFLLNLLNVHIKRISSKIYVLRSDTIDNILEGIKIVDDSDVFYDCKIDVKIKRTKKVGWFEQQKS